MHLQRAFGFNYDGLQLAILKMAPEDRKESAMLKPSQQNNVS